MNIALIVLDTLRKDTFDRHFDWLPGTHYENAWSTSHWTIPAHTSLFTGQYASEVGTFARSMTLDYEGDTLAERLAGTGYTTRAFSANVGISPLFDFDRGFQQFERSRRLEFAAGDVYDWQSFLDKYGEEGPLRYLRGLKSCLESDTNTRVSLRRGLELKLRNLGIELGDPDDGAARALEMIESIPFGRDEFLFMNLMEAHGPFNPPQDYRTVTDYEMPDHPLGHDFNGDIDPDPVQQAYDDNVRYLSDIYRDIFETLKADFDHIITLSDHGNCFGEHGVYGHTYGLYPELTHVPLCIWDGGDTRHENNQPVSLLDVHQTILNLANIDAKGRGQSLRTEIEPLPFLTEYHGITQTEKIDNLRRAGVSEATIERYDRPLDGVIIPQESCGYETHDGIVVEGDVDEDTVKDRIETLTGELDRKGSRSGTEFDDAVLQQLEDLGYA